MNLMILNVDERFLPAYSDAVFAPHGNNCTTIIFKNRLKAEDNKFDYKDVVLVIRDRVFLLTILNRKDYFSLDQKKVIQPQFRGNCEANSGNCCIWLALL